MTDIPKLVEAIKQARESSKRKFKQSFDLVINLKDLDMKRPEHQVDFFIALPHGKGKKNKIAGLIGPEMIDEAKANLDFFVLQDDFDKWTAKAKARKLAEDYDFFVAQANIMTKIASAFGRVFGVRGKMPNPKAGCVVPPKTSLKPLVERLSKTVRVQAKSHPMIQVMVGTEEMKDEQIAENLDAVLKQLLNTLVSGKQNIKNAMIKTTMGAPVKIEV
jgi:large subunit ribosomal protein L1